MTFSIDEGIEPSEVSQALRLSALRPVKLTVEEESKVIESRWNRQ